MPLRDWRVALHEMRFYAERCIEVAGGMSGDELEANYLRASSVSRSMELIGEAANRVPPAQRERLTALPWSQLVGLRNVLIHRYDEVNYDIVAHIVQAELPVLLEKLNAIIEQESP